MISIIQTGYLTPPIHVVDVVIKTTLAQTLDFFVRNCALAI